MEIFRLMGSIFVDNDKANSAIDETDNKAKGTGKTLSDMIGTAAKWGAGLAAGAVAAGGALFALASKSSETASEINDLGVKTGMSMSRLQELKFITGQVGSDFGVVEKSIAKLTQSMGKADEEGKGMAVAFEKIGIETRNVDGSMRPAAQVFDEALIALSGMTNETERNVLAFQIFGKGANDLVPLMAAGKDGLEQMRQKAHEYGLVLSDEAIAANDEFGDKLDAVQFALSMVGTNIGTVLLPAFQSMLEWVLAHMPEIRSTITTVFTFVSGAVDGSTTAVRQLTQFFQEHWGVIQPILAGIGAGAATFGIYTVAINASAWATKLWTATTAAATVAGTAFSAVLAFITSPIGLVVIAIAAVVAAGVALYKNWDTVMEQGNKLVAVLKDAFGGLADFIVGVWDGIWGGIKWTLNQISSGVNVMIRGMNRLKFEAPDWVPGMGGKSWGINIPEIPMLAKGGEIAAAGAVLVGEVGPELLELPRGARVTPLDAAGSDLLSDGVKLEFNFPNLTVNGTDDFAKKVKAVIEREVVPILASQLRQPARARG